MAFKLAILSLLIVLLSVENGDTWGRRRRRGGGWLRRTWRKAKNVVRKGYNIYQRYKPWINYGWGLLGDEASTYDDLATLKKYDRDSYDEFLKKVKAALEGKFPEEESDMTIEAIEEITDMQPDERDEFLKEMKQDILMSHENQHLSDELQNELAMRVASIE